MNAIRRIRCEILQLTQAELARAAGTTQATVSRWERDEAEPSLSEMTRIRTRVKEAGLPWDDAWFFEPPPAMAGRKAVAA
ncbi:helix-turn-helix transcriptional regulator [Azospirillum picis]|uniref:Transcriptional regulator with XRE-family HTH domain n=1 Tax=Azospirillum picis TaxID=488438 RepID=A0ABU0MEI0_9PROT|nr:helix-turn-helix transcriptional regulator [Azospirillum picis]MBP2297979.1 transcriptional regulator with XRE-family HTH domain [Azospirillum picis]MDQ0531817.1 transcriptional regulator with XRE-family HTH domain [Azospirillum picis]